MRIIQYFLLYAISICVAFLLSDSMMSSALFRRSFSCYCGAVRMVRTRPLRQLTKSKGSWTFKSKVSLSVMAPIALSRRLLAEEVHVPSAPVIEFSKARSGPGTSLVQCVRLLLADVYSAFRTFLRACQLAVICSPLFVLTPVALWWPDRYHVSISYLKMRKIV